MCTAFVSRECLHRGKTDPFRGLSIVVTVSWPHSSCFDALQGWAPSEPVQQGSGPNSSQHIHPTWTKVPLPPALELRPLFPGGLQGPDPGSQVLALSGASLFYWGNTRAACFRQIRVYWEFRERQEQHELNTISYHTKCFRENKSRSKRKAGFLTNTFQQIWLSLRSAALPVVTNNNRPPCTRYWVSEDWIFTVKTLIYLLSLITSLMYNLSSAAMCLVLRELEDGQFLTV